MLTRRALLIGGGAAGLTILTRRSAQADPALVGAWSPRVRLPHIAIHLSALPGRNAIWCAQAKGLIGTRSWIHDFDTGLTTDCSIPFNYDMMCGGTVLTEEGEIAALGGRVAANLTAVFDPVKATWRLGPVLSDNKARYYCASVRTGPLPGYPAGAILAAAGRRPSIDIIDAHATAARLTALPASANLLLTLEQIYPRLHVLPDGTIFLGGQTPLLRRLHLPSAQWTTLASMGVPRRTGGCCTPLPGSGWEFLLSGGEPGVARNTMERVDARTGVVRFTTPMAQPRFEPNTVLLPDGTVLLLGGKGEPNPNWPELYDPVAETCTRMADTLPGPDKPAFRGYHSSGDLCDDGTAVIAGGVAGTNGFSCERFFPPYLFRGPRPTLTVVPGAEQVPHGGLLTATASPIARVVLMRPGPMSHGYNPEQRHLECAFTRAGGVLLVTMPTNRHRAPAGWYRLFVLSGDGVPSLAQWIRLVG